MPPNPEQFLQEARDRMAAKYGAEKVYDLNILLSGVKQPTGDEIIEIHNRHASRYPVAPKDRAMTREEKADFERRTFLEKRAEDHEMHRLEWDMKVLQNEIERRVERFRVKADTGFGGSSALTIVPGPGGVAMRMVIGPVMEGEALRKCLGLSDATLNGRMVTASIRSSDMPDAPVLPQDPMDLAGCACAYLKVGDHHYYRIALDLLTKTMVDPKRPEVPRALAEFIQGPAKHVMQVNQATIILAHWATPEQTDLLRDLARPDNHDTNPEAKKYAALALRNMKLTADRDAKERTKKSALPKNLDEATPEQLAGALPGASVSKRTELLQRLEEGKGIAYSAALADIIPRLEAKDKVAARATLQRRMMRMSLKTLADYLGDRDPEMRLAAIGAVAEKKIAEMVPALIQLVDLGDAETAPAAHAALEKITGKTVTLPAAPTATDWPKIAKQWRER